MRRTKTRRNHLHRSGQSLIGIILLICAVAGIFILQLAHIPLQFSFLFLLGAIVFLVSFLKTDFALVLLIFSMLLSPEMSAGQVTGREVTVRAEDIFLFVVFLGWLSRMAVHKELGLLRVTPMNQPILLYVGVSLVSMLLGAVRGAVGIKEGLFYFLKYFEYYLLFFMVANNLKNNRQIRVFIFSFIFVAFIISLYAWFQHFSGVTRVSTPFEGKMGEANTLGGYLVLMIMLILGLFFNTPVSPLKIFLGAVLVLAFPALLFTLSRGSWLGFLLAFLTLIFLIRKGKSLLFFAFLVMVLFSPIIMPRYVQERVQSTFVHDREFTLFGRQVGLDESAAARVDNWQYGLQKWAKAPILGHGVGSAGPSVDNQYTRVLVEVGAIGFLAFIWVMFALYQNAMAAYSALKEESFCSGIIAGFLAGFIGLLTHSFSAATFIIIRIMEPFWFLAALVIMLPHIWEPQQAK